MDVFHSTSMHHCLDPPVEIVLIQPFIFTFDGGILVQLIDDVEQGDNDGAISRHYLQFGRHIKYWSSLISTNAVAAELPYMARLGKMFRRDIKM